jgi:hypothetical protein
MSGTGSHYIEVEGETINLRNRALAAFLAWLWPGAGHLYQKRYFKGWLMMVCVLTTFYVGLSIGGGRVVYASLIPQDRRWHFIFQGTLGLPTLPAWIQLKYLRDHTDASGRTDFTFKPLWGGYMAPPPRPVREGANDTLAHWHEETGAGFELGSWYTVIAGLLNLLAIFDAYGGPLNIAISGRRVAPSDEEEGDEEDEASSRKDSVKGSKSV